MRLEQIIEMPQVLNNTHESSYRCYHILETVLEMVGRGDSKESIADLADFLKYAKSFKDIQSLLENPKSPQS